MAVKAGILKKGDDVINVWSQGEGISVAVKQKNGEVCIHSISPDENGNMRVDKDASLLITFGNGEVQTSTSVTPNKEDVDTQQASETNTVEVVTF
ncbi:hypothetical protein NDI52_28015 [Leptolyngbya sp. PL-A3]|uniref:hypothetical protein n=1 Tax=Leptolyngbya sp. PL-A3 TaxID=2933911 RepID=UPI0032983FFF